MLPVALFCSQRALARRTAVGGADFAILPRLHNELLLGPAPPGEHCSEGAQGLARDGTRARAGGEGGGADGRGGAAGSGALGSAWQRGRTSAVHAYLPSALHHLSRHCPRLETLVLELPAPPAPQSRAAAVAARAAAWEAGGAAGGPGAHMDAECPPVDGYLLKLLAQCCPLLRRLRLINLSNNHLVSRLARPNDACLAVLGRSCPRLEELWLGNHGSGEALLSPDAAATSYYFEDVTDAGLVAVAKHCTRLSDPRAHHRRRALRLTVCDSSLVLLDCFGISDRALMEVAEKCGQLRRLDVVAARRPQPPQPLLGLLAAAVAGAAGGGGGGAAAAAAAAAAPAPEEQLGFRALFTIAANCAALEELCISEEGLEQPAVDDDGLLCIGQGCQRLRRLALRHCAGATDAGVASLARRCKQLEEVVLEQTGVGDAGVLAVARGCPRLAALHLTSYSGGLSSPGPRVSEAQPGRDVSDAALRHIAEHCGSLRDLSISGCRQVTDAGLQALSASRLPGFHSRLTALALNHVAVTDAGVRALLQARRGAEIWGWGGPRGGARRSGAAALLAALSCAVAPSAMLAAARRCTLQRCCELRSLGVRGLLFSADGTVREAALHCRNLREVDLRHCSTLSDAGLAALAGCAHLQARAAAGAPRVPAPCRALRAICSGVHGRGTIQGGGMAAHELGIASWGCHMHRARNVDNAAVRALAAACPRLERLNLGRTQAEQRCLRRALGRSALGNGECCWVPGMKQVAVAAAATNGVPGVTYHNGGWQSYLRIDNKQVSLPNQATEEDAAHARDRARAIVKGDGFNEWQLPERMTAEVLAATCAMTLDELKAELRMDIDAKKSSRYKGVSWDKGGQKWRAQLRIDGKKKNVGLFTDEAAAARAYDRAAIKRDSSAAKTNFPLTDYISGEDALDLAAIDAALAAGAPVAEAGPSGHAGASGSGGRRASSNPRAPRCAGGGRSASQAASRGSASSSAARAGSARVSASATACARPPVPMDPFHPPGSFPHKGFYGGHLDPSGWTYLDPAAYEHGREVQVSKEQFYAWRREHYQARREKETSPFFPFMHGSTGLDLPLCGCPEADAVWEQWEEEKSADFYVANMAEQAELEAWADEHGLLEPLHRLKARGRYTEEEHAAACREVDKLALAFLDEQKRQDAEQIERHYEDIRVTIWELSAVWGPMLDVMWNEGPMDPDGPIYDDEGKLLRRGRGLPDPTPEERAAMPYAGPGAWRTQAEEGDEDDLDAKIYPNADGSMVSARDVGNMVLARLTAMPPLPPVTPREVTPADLPQQRGSAILAGAGTGGAGTSGAAGPSCGGGAAGAGGAAGTSSAGSEAGPSGEKRWRWVHPGGPLPGEEDFADRFYDHVKRRFDAYLVREREEGERGSVVMCEMFRRYVRLTQFAPDHLLEMKPEEKDAFLSDLAALREHFGPVTEADVDEAEAEAAEHAAWQGEGGPPTPRHVHFTPQQLAELRRKANVIAFH
eukprot:scaffold12.g8202.t1